MSYDFKDPNLIAFLKLIRVTENEDRPDSWYRVNDGTAIGKLVDDAALNNHPGIIGDKPAGAYQIRYSTFLAFGGKAKYKNFKPLAQSMCACDIMEQVWVGNAYKDVINGNWKEAIRKLTSKRQWTSLPGGSEQRRTQSQALAILQSHPNTHWV